MAHVTSDQTSTPKSGFFRNFVRRFLKMREAQGRQIAALHAANFSDEQLANYGWTNQQIERLRRGGGK